METKIRTFEQVEKIIDKNIDFPYYGWWSYKKEEIIKIDLVLSICFPGRIDHLKIIKIQSGFAIKSSITSDRLTISDEGIIHGDIIYLLRDYADIATAQEYSDFRESVIDELV